MITGAIQFQSTCLLVVNRATSGPNQSEREKDNRGIVLGGHVTH